MAIKGATDVRIAPDGTVTGAAPGTTYSASGGLSGTTSSVAAPTITVPATGYQYVKSDGSIGTTSSPTATPADADPHSGTIANPPGIYGSLDGSSNSITADTSSTRAKESQQGNTITQMSSSVSPAFDTSYLDQLEEQEREQALQDNSAINQNYDQQEKDLADTQGTENATTSVALARAGGYLGNSGSGTGVMLNLAASHRAELGKLQNLRQQALTAAAQGHGKDAMAITQQRIDLAKQYEQEAYQRQQSFTESTQKVLDQRAISNAISAGAKTPQDIFNQLGGNVAIEDINSFLKSVTPESTGGFDFTPTDTSLLLGSGLSQKDIQSVLTYVNENGYSDDLRKSLTSQERSVLDGIFYPKAPKASGAGGTAPVGGTLTIAEAKSLGLPVSLIGRNQNQVITDLQGNTPPVWYQEYVQNQKEADFTPEALTGMWDTFRNSILAKNEGKAPADSSGGAAASSPKDDYDSF